MTKNPAPALPALGWREWVALPDLGIDRIKCKVDTGARSSALHAWYLERFREDGRDRVRFGIHPLQRRQDIEKVCTADLLDEREVTDSGGHRERRAVIETTVALGDVRWQIEMTLTDRDTMLFRMLLGRTAVRRHFLVDPARSYIVSRRKARRG